MLTVRFDRRKGGTLKVLCLGAHSDDIEIGCGGTILQLLKSGRDLVICWVVFSASEKRKKEAEASARALLKRAKKKEIILHGFRDGYFPYLGAQIKDSFESLKKIVSPDLIFAPRREDLHQDHRLVSELTWNTFRDHVILEYEIAKYDGDLGTPNVYVPLDEATCRMKAAHIARHFRSQAGNHWFDEDAFLSLMRLRGIESNAPAGYAEAFCGRKVLLGL
jgi:LmbE family N-acetylglucosaminyl deacetylase